jgi:hypothetical protein
MATLGIFAGYLVFLLLLALPHGLATSFSWELWWNQKLYHFPPTDTAKDVVDLFCYPSGDQIWFAKAAILLATNSFTDADYWILAIFAPGLTAIEFALLKVFGLNCPIVLYLCIITCAAWALVLLNLQKLAVPRMGKALSYLAPIPICISIIWRQYCLQGGILLTETLSIAFLAASFLMLLRANINKSLSLAICSGVSLAIAAYIRTQIEMIGTALALVTMLAIAGQLILDQRKRTEKQQHTDSVRTNFWVRIRLFANNHTILKYFAIVVFVFFFCTAPYRLWNFYKFHNFSWLQVDYYWKMGWQSESELAKTDDSWIARGGMLVPAYVNPQLAVKIQAHNKVLGASSYSDSFYRWRTVTTFLRHPVKWIIYKARLLPWFWFAPINSHISLGLATMAEVAENWIYAAITIFCLVRFLVIPSIQRNFPEQQAVYTLFYSGVVIAGALTFVFVHFEPRYFYSIKIFSTIMLLSYLIRKRSTSAGLP